jgi:RimJ/RimL family protein N-acetyltransferase
LRQWQPQDHEPFAALNADPAVMEFLGEPLSRAASDALAERCAQGIAERGWGAWAVEHREDGTFLGFVGLSPVGADLPFAPAVEVAWRLQRSAWGQGHATEAAQCALAFAFEQLGFAEIVSFTALANHRSAAVMQRLGMNCEGTFEHPRLPEGHTLRTHVLYLLRAPSNQET